MSQPLYRLGLVGSAGYAGQTFQALCQSHPKLSLRSLATRAHPMEAVLDDLDALVLAVPSEVSKQWVAHHQGAGSLPPLVLDFSDAFRLHSNPPHDHSPKPSTLDCHYGLPEIMGKAPKQTQVIANPGCYPTATLLALRPLLAAACIAPHGIAVHGCSAASGAGKNPQDHLHFCNLHENTFPYKVGEHRHIPEIEHILGAPITFVSQILPMVRGMLVTAYVQPQAGHTPASLRACLQDYYAPHPYVEVLERPDQSIGVRHVAHKHQALLAVGPHSRSGLIPIFASIDNLMRGAASQALMNLNLYWNLDPSLGLPAALPPMTSPIPSIHF